MDDTERQVHRLRRQWWALSVACIGLWLIAGIAFAIAGNWPAAFSDLTFACLTAFYLWSLRNAENENAELRGFVTELLEQKDRLSVALAKRAP